MEALFDVSEFGGEMACFGFSIREVFDEERISEGIQAVTTGFEKDSNPNTWGRLLTLIVVKRLGLLRRRSSSCSCWQNYPADFGSSSGL
jgi:hypothetical protein